MPLNAEQLASGESDIEVIFRGETCRVWYRTTQVTKEFKAKAARLDREAKRIERRQQQLQEVINRISAADDTPEAKKEDEEAEKAIQQLIADDETIKRMLDVLICEVVSRWEVNRSDGSMLPITPENLFPVPAQFEGLIIGGINQAASMGEATGPNSQTILPSTSKQREEQEIGPQSLSYITTSSPANGALP